VFSSPFRRVRRRSLIVVAICVALITLISVQQSANMREPRLIIYWICARLPRAISIRRLILDSV
jgi:hypothetical protein